MSSTRRLLQQLNPYPPSIGRLRWRQWVVPMALGSLLLVLVLQEGLYLVLLNQLDLGFPKSRRNILSRDTTTTTTTTTITGPPPFHLSDQTSIAVVTSHRAWKFGGYFRTWWTSHKKRYAQLHGYAYFEDLVVPPPTTPPTTSTTFHRLNTHSSLHDPPPSRQMEVDKLYSLLYIMETYPTLQYVLWLDGEALVTQATISIEDRIQLFQQQHKHKQQQKVHHKKHQVITGIADTDAADTAAADEEDEEEYSPFCLVWAVQPDSPMPNTGVLLFANTPSTRQLISTTLMTMTTTTTTTTTTTNSEQTSWLHQTVNSNTTYSSCQILLNDDESRLLQSRIKGKSTTKWTPGDWILHLPHHNRLQMLLSLYQSLRGASHQQKCQTLAPLDRPDVSTLPLAQRQRFQAVQEAIRHAWKGYRTYAHSQDDLAPLSRKGISWLNYAATLHDSIDTLYLANLTQEYDEAVELVTAYDIQTTSLRVTKTFEYSIRVMGGLLGAYSLSGDPRLLAAATRAADALLEGPFRSSPTVLPRPFGMLAPSGWDGILYWVVARIYEWGRDHFTNEHRTNSLAGVGSFALEFKFLSLVSGDPTYRRVVDDIFHLLKTRERKGMIPIAWNVMTGTAITGPSNPNLGSAADSFYEYLLKVPLLNQCGPLGGYAMGKKDTCSKTDLEMVSIYQDMVRESLRPLHVVTQTLDGKGFRHEDVSFPVDDSVQYHHLLCFLPGLLALGAAENLGDAEDMGLAMDLLLGCHATYQIADTGLGPESATLTASTPTKRMHHTRNADTTMSASFERFRPSYLLRPEFVESLFIMYRLTRDTKFQDMAWEVFESLETYCRVDSGGYTGLKDVFLASTSSSNANANDEMPSYFIAETLKYLLLIFGPDEYVSLHDFVFTTEAHPLRIQQQQQQQQQQRQDDLGVGSLPWCTTPRTRIPVPWSLLFCLLLIALLVSAVSLGYVRYGRAVTWGACGKFFLNPNSKRKAS